jgi:hypothetical protein
MRNFPVRGIVERVERGGDKIKENFHMALFLAV